MNKEVIPVIFGEVLFDCFPDGSQVLGGAPFNVAWHLQAFGNKPMLVSSVGNDPEGDLITKSMKNWGMNTENLQVDNHHPTGKVLVSIVNNEPQYTIVEDCAYDFIKSDKIRLPDTDFILYHGTLGLRNSQSRMACERLVKQSGCSIFLDVNLRDPWWNRDHVLELVKQARWVKLNHLELDMLAPAQSDLNTKIAQFQQDLDIDILIVTFGKDGACIRSRDGNEIKSSPDTVTKVVDTIGAGDAFTSVVLHGLMANLPLPDILDKAQNFASAVVGLRGAITDDPDFYEQIRPGSPIKN